MAQERSWFAAFFDAVTLTLTNGVVAGGDAIVSAFSPLTWFLGSALASVFWTIVGRHLVCWLQWAFCWLIKVVLGIALPMLVGVLKLLPAFPSLVMEPLVESWKLANYYGPVNEIVLGSAVMLFVVGAFRFVRFVKQFVPAVSN
jgi:hypothetical protein